MIKIPEIIQAVPITKKSTIPIITKITPQPRGADLIRREAINATTDAINVIHPRFANSLPNSPGK